MFWASLSLHQRQHREEHAAESVQQSEAQRNIHGLTADSRWYITFAQSGDEMPCVS